MGSLVPSGVVVCQGSGGTPHPSRNYAGEARGGL